MPDEELKFVIKGFFVGLCVFNAVVIIAFERWIHNWLHKRKFKTRGIKTIGFINNKKAVLDGKTMLTSHNMNIEFLVQNDDQSKQFIVFVEVNLMPKVKYMIDGFDYAVEINVRYIPKTTYILDDENPIEYYLIGAKDDIDAKQHVSKRCWKTNLKLFLLSVCFLIGSIPFIWAITDPSFANVGIINWTLGIIGGTIYFFMKPKRSFETNVVNIMDNVTDDHLSKYKQSPNIQLELQNVTQ